MICTLVPTTNLKWRIWLKAKAVTPRGQIEGVAEGQTCVGKRKGCSRVGGLCGLPIFLMVKVAFFEKVGCKDGQSPMHPIVCWQRGRCEREQQSDNSAMDSWPLRDATMSAGVPPQPRRSIARSLRESCNERRLRQRGYIFLRTGLIANRNRTHGQGWRLYCVHQPQLTRNIPTPPLQYHLRPFPNDGQSNFIFSLRLDPCPCRFVRSI